MIRSHPDIINDVITPDIGSIKETRIDGYLDKKFRWSGEKWIDACRVPGCSSVDIENDQHICNLHYRSQLNYNLVGEIIYKKDRKYKWSGKEWKLMCTTNMCSSYATSSRSGKCQKHVKNSNVHFSSLSNTVNLYHQLKHDVVFSKKKKKNEEEKKKKSEEQEAMINELNERT